MTDDEVFDYLMEKVRYAPDDSGREWVNPWLWTPNEVHDLVMENVGIDETFVRGYQILIKLWHPGEKMSNGFYNTPQKVRDIMQRCMIGKILRMGKECFTDKARFPAGPRFTYGEWAVFRGVERQKAEKTGIMLASVHDDRFIMADDNPDTLVTTLELERDLRDA
jgi:hypothetical protein